MKVKDMDRICDVKIGINWSQLGIIKKLVGTEYLQKIAIEKEIPVSMSDKRKKHNLIIQQSILKEAVQKAHLNTKQHKITRIDMLEKQIILDDIKNNNYLYYVKATVCFLPMIYQILCNLDEEEEFYRALHEWYYNGDKKALSSDDKDRLLKQIMETIHFDKQVLMQSSDVRKKRILARKNGLYASFCKEMKEYTDNKALLDDLQKAADKIGANLNYETTTNINRFKKNEKMVDDLIKDENIGEKIEEIRRLIDYGVEEPGKETRKAAILDYYLLFPYHPNLFLALLAKMKYDENVIRYYRVRLERMSNVEVEKPEEYFFAKNFNYGIKDQNGKIVYISDVKGGKEAVLAFMKENQIPRYVCLFYEVAKRYLLGTLTNQVVIAQTKPIQYKKNSFTIHPK